MPRTKRNNESKFYKDWTTKKLKDYAKEYHDLIYGRNSCYGSSDLQILDGVLNELYNRGIEPQNKLEF